MLYYGRYAVTRLLLGLSCLNSYSILRYLETGKSRYLVLLTIATILHFTVKETAFIYTAQAYCSGSLSGQPRHPGTLETWNSP